jgi:Arc/MetJ family transcription regulator
MARTTVDIDEKLLAKAQKALKLPTKTATIEEGLRLILRREAIEKLIAARGSMPDLEPPPRRRF